MNRWTAALLLALAACGSSDDTVTTTTTAAATTTEFSVPDPPTLPESTTTTAGETSASSEPATTSTTETQPDVDLAGAERSIRDYYLGSPWLEHMVSFETFGPSGLQITTDLPATEDTAGQAQDWCGVASGWLTTNAATFNVQAVRIATVDGQRINIATGPVDTCEGPDF